MRYAHQFLVFLYFFFFGFGFCGESGAQVFRWADRFGAIDGQIGYDDPFDIVLASDSSLYVVGIVQKETLDVERHYYYEIDYKDPNDMKLISGQRIIR